MGNANNVTAEKPRTAGGIFRAPLGTTLPTTATESLAAAFKDLGYISADGVTNSRGTDISTEKAWGGDTVNVLDNGTTNKFKFKLLETINVEVLKEAFGDENVTGTLAEGIVVKSNSKEKGAHSYVIDTILKGGVLKRTVIPNAMISELGDLVLKGTESAGYEITLTAQNDTAGNDHYVYIQSPSTPAVVGE